MRLGAHVSTAGGVSAAFDRAVEVTAECMQIFTRNQNQWAGKPLAAGEAERFRQRRKETGIGPNVAHASYLINLATRDPDLERKSIAAFSDEVARADLLGIEYLVFHPGSHLGAGVEAGLRLVAARLDRVMAEAGPDSRVTILLENTAGQGTNLGFEFSQLRDVIGQTKHADRLAVCLDTCHAFAAGYRLTDREGYEAMVQELAATVGLARVCAFHLNDSKKELGSRKDRHEQIDQGLIHAAPFAFLIKDPRFRGRPAALETPLAEQRYKQELELLRSL